jgi:Cyclic nucleotide-binding domain
VAFGKGKEEDVVSLIAAKKYARAIEVLKAQLQKKGANPSLRMQLADVLLLADKKQEAVSLLIPLADQYATEGFAAKAVSVLKKIQKIDPGRRDVEQRLARQIEEKQREATALPLTRSGGEGAGFDEGPSLEIGFDAAPISAPPTVGSPEPYVPVLPVTPAAAFSSPDATLPVEPARAMAPPDPSPVFALPDPGPELALPAEPAFVFPVSPEPAFAPVVEPLERAPLPPRASPPPVAAAPPSADSEFEDYDLKYIAEASEAEEEFDVPMEAELVEPEAQAEPMSAGQFADELIGLVDSVFSEFQAAPSAPTAPGAGATDDEPRGGSQIVVSPLFRDFSVDEMVAVIQGLRLLTYERGAVILREGQGGGSLYMLTAGRVRAFKKSADGKQNPLGDLTEGAFFGEMSILTGQPRMASVVALSPCELLELDRPTLDGITKTHPHVWDVLREFAEKRRVPAQG